MMAIQITIISLIILATGNAKQTGHGGIIKTIANGGINFQPNATPVERRTSGYLKEIAERARLNKIRRIIGGIVPITTSSTSHVTVEPENKGTTARPVAEQVADRVPISDRHIAMANDAGLPDIHVVKFATLSSGNISGLYIKSATVHLTLKRYNRRQSTSLRSGGRRSRRCRKKFVTLKVRDVKSNGKPGSTLSRRRIPFRCKKEIVPMILKPEIIQSAMNDGKREVLFYINCNGCKRKAKLGFARGRKRKRKGSGRKTKKRRSSKKLNDDRPFLYLIVERFHVVNRRSVRDEILDEPVCNAEHTCCKYTMRVNLISLGFGERILAPTSFVDHYCMGLCSGPPSNNGSTNMQIVYPNGTSLAVNSCEATRSRSLSVLVLNGDGNVIPKIIRNLIATSCGCSSRYDIP